MERSNQPQPPLAEDGLVLLSIAEQEALAQELLSFAASLTRDALNRRQLQARIRCQKDG